MVAAPAALGRRLALAGWVDDAALGRDLQPHLTPGQRLVDRDGRLWRWDGFTRSTAAPSAASRQLHRQNRLAELAPSIAAAEAAVATGEDALVAARSAREAAAQSEGLARQRLREAESALSEARKREADLSRRAFAAETRRAAIDDRIAAFKDEEHDIEEAAERVVLELAALPANPDVETNLAAAREEAAVARQRERAAFAASDNLARAATDRGRRHAAIEGEERSWRARADRSTSQHAVLVERRDATVAELAELSTRPAAIAGQSERLGAELATVTQDGRRAADALAAAETARREAEEAARAADLSLAAAREDRVRQGAAHDRAAEAMAALVHDIRERLDATPEDLAARLGPDAESAPTDPAAAAARLDRLTRERDGVGPVNLVAERDAAEIEARLAELRRERAELTEAIQRLRRGLAALDREGRQRLTAALDRLNGHFAELFARLFGGGKAELALVGDDDPLAAGLDILATPPGKRRQALSLLSGGEQALTALALIFALFLTNPAPLCVLDEVDAPLDDANIDRFCRLLAEIADAAATRFLVMTHHRITMARVDRLFGVTMAEDGVSQLVSVDFSARPAPAANRLDPPAPAARPDGPSLRNVALTGGNGVTIVPASRPGCGRGGCRTVTLLQMSENPPPDPLARLGERIDRARQEQLRGDPGARGEPPRGALGLGLRMAVELAASLCVGLGLGWLTDRFLGTRPWGLIVFFFLGIAAGMLNVFRAAKGVGHGYGGTPGGGRDKAKRD